MDSFELDVFEEQQDVLPNITLSADQENAADMVCDWFTDTRQVAELRGEGICQRFKMAGLAGTGKSTIIPFVISRLELRPWNIHYCAYTGKAALVLRSKGLGATTIHRFIYDVISKPNGEVEFQLKDRLDKRIKLIVVDEASMIGKQIRQDLESFGVPVLYVGDHGQLPPVGDEVENMLRNPDVKLERIHRQAEGNPIIMCAMRARDSGRLNHGQYGGTVKKIRKFLLDRRELTTVDQVLCGKNLTRQKLNHEIRDLIYREPNISPLPRVGDKLICLRNDYGTGLVNGMMGKFSVLGAEQTLPVGHYRGTTFVDEEDYTYRNLNTPIHHFIGKGKELPYLKDFHVFDYGYAITVHKSQGSQYKNGVVFEEWLGNSDVHRLWLYTAITRFIDGLTIVQG